MKTTLLVDRLLPLTRLDLYTPALVPCFKLVVRCTGVFELFADLGFWDVQLLPGEMLSAHRSASK